MAAKAKTANDVGVGTIAWALCCLRRVRLKEFVPAQPWLLKEVTLNSSKGTQGKWFRARAVNGDGPARPSTRVRAYPTVGGHPITGHASVNGGSQDAQCTEDPMVTYPTIHLSDSA